MKRRLILGVVLALTAVLMLSCNKNRFDFNHLESVEGSGQWKLPIGTAHTTLGDVLTQFNDNGLISPDEDGNLQVAYSFQLNNLIKGANFLSLGSLNFSTTFEFDNPLPGIVLPVAIDTMVHLSQEIRIDADSATIESAVVKTGTLNFVFHQNFGQIDSIVISSHDITMLGGDTLRSTMEEIDLAGATFRLHDENGVADSTLVLNYDVYYKLSGSEVPKFELQTLIGLNNLKLQELSGYVDQFVYDFALDTALSLPLGNLQGELDLVGTKISIKEKNTFVNFRAILGIEQAEFYGANAGSSPLFNHYPYVLDIIPTNTFYNIMDEETLNINYKTDYYGFRFNGSIDFNPAGTESLIVIYDTSSISLGVDAVIPMRFNIPNVTYVDTLDLNLNDISAPELVEKIVLNIMFESEMPFNLSAQFYTFNSKYGVVTGTLLDNELVINGSFDGAPVPSEANITLDHDLLKKLLEADKLIMRYAVNTANQDVNLNLDNGLGLTLKADVFYGGSLDFSNF